MSDEVRDDLVRFGVADAAQIEVVPYGFDLPPWTEADDASRARDRSRLGIGEDTFVVGWAGRLTAIKRPLDLVRTLRALLDLGVDAQLVVVGDGADRRRSKRSSPSSESATVADSSASIEGCATGTPPSTRRSSLPRTRVLRSWRSSLSPPSARSSQPEPAALRRWSATARPGSWSRSEIPTRSRDGSRSSPAMTSGAPALAVAALRTCGNVLARRAWPRARRRLPQDARRVKSSISTSSLGSAAPRATCLHCFRRCGQPGSTLASSASTCPEATRRGSTAASRISASRTATFGAAPTSACGWHVTSPGLSGRGIRLIHTHLVHGDVYGALAAAALRIPYLSTRHNDDRYLLGPFRYVDRAFAHRARRLIAISDAVRRFLEQAGHARRSRNGSIRTG